MPKLLKSKKETKSKSAEPKEERAVIYSGVKAEVCQGDKAITVGKAKKLLGWEEETEGQRFGGNYQLTDAAGKKIRCTNNITNRPIYSAVHQMLKQEILRGRWYFNGEPIIIGRTGLILNGQHTLIGLILAAQDWAADRERWAALTEEPTMEKLIVYGVEETDVVVNTMDTCKPRSLSDVLYRSEFFVKLKESDRRHCSKALDYAIRLLWYRTGVNLAALAPHRTHSESLDFLARHHKLMACVKHIYEEDGKEHKLSRDYISIGYAAGLLYLMGSSKTDSDEYRGSDNPKESMLDWSNWSKACDFWVLLAAGGKEVQAIRQVFGQVSEIAKPSNAERWAILCNAWLAYLDDEPITAKAITPLYVDLDDGGRKLAEHPSVGGIDIGSPDDVDESQIPNTTDPAPKEVSKRASKLQEQKLKLIPKRAGDEWAKGDVAWVCPKGDDESYLATLADEPYKTEFDGSIRVMVLDSEKREWQVPVADLFLERKVRKLAPMPQASKRKFPKTPAPEPTRKLPGKKAKPWEVRDMVWVNDGEPYRGRIVELDDRLKVARIKVDNGFAGAGNVKVAALNTLTTKQPSTVVA